MKILFTIWGIRIPFFGTMIALGMLAAMWVLSSDAKRKNIDPEKATDMGVWALVGGILGVRIGCDVYGTVMRNPKFWGIAVNGNIYQPAQVYEFFLDFILFFYLWRKRKNKKYEGQLFGIYLIGFTVIRSIVELFRGNPRILGIISVSHLLSLSLILAGLLWMKVASKRYETRIKSKLKCFSFQMETLVLIVVLIISTAIFYGVQLSL